MSYVDEALEMTLAHKAKEEEAKEVLASIPDLVNHPPHYVNGGIETIDFLRAKLGREGFVAYCRGNALKYLSRAGRKGDAREDFLKAEWYVRRAAEELASHEEASVNDNGSSFSSVIDNSGAGLHDHEFWISGYQEWQGRAGE